MKALKLSSLALAMALAAGYANATTQTYTAPSVLGVGDSYIFGEGLSNLQATIDAIFSFKLAAGVTGVNFVFNTSSSNDPITTFSAIYNGSTLSLTGGNEYDPADSSWLNQTQYSFNLTSVPTGVNQTVDLHASYAPATVVAGNYTLTVTAVPEPESYALLLAGLGLMAAVARRKAKLN